METVRTVDRTRAGCGGTGPGRCCRGILDPRTDRNVAALLPDDGTASPTVGPDGDVYFGVLESTFGAHNARGWLLHFNSTLATQSAPGGFGWDNTPSIVPAAMVPSYAGSSTYLLMSKYNDYISAGGGGYNQVAILDYHHGWHQRFCQFRR